MQLVSSGVLGLVIRLKVKQWLGLRLEYVRFWLAYKMVFCSQLTVCMYHLGTVGGSLLSDNVVTNIPRPNEVDKGRSKNKDCRPSNNQIDRM